MHSGRSETSEVPLSISGFSVLIDAARRRGTFLRLAKMYGREKGEKWGDGEGLSGDAAELDTRMAPLSPARISENIPRQKV